MLCDTDREKVNLTEASRCGLENKDISDKSISYWFVLSHQYTELCPDCDNHALRPS